MDYALDHPSLFGLMMSTPCAMLPEEGAAVDELHDCIAAAVLPLWADEYAAEEERETLFFALWSWIHGAAMLHLEGKVDATDRASVHRRIRDSWRITGLDR